MTTPSKLFTGVQDAYAQCATLWMVLLEMNVEVAFDTSSDPMKFNLALASWVVMTVTGGLCALLWHSRKG